MPIPTLAPVMAIGVGTHVGVVASSGAICTCKRVVDESSATRPVLIRAGLTCSFASSVSVLKPKAAGEAN